MASRVSVSSGESISVISSRYSFVADMEVTHYHSSPQSVREVVRHGAARDICLISNHGGRRVGVTVLHKQRTAAENSLPRQRFSACQPSPVRPERTALDFDRSVFEFVCRFRPFRLVS